VDEHSTKNRILDISAALFGEYGIDAVSTTRIAREAGINKAMIFYYFGTKEGLYRAAVRKWIDDIVSVITKKVGEAEPGLPMIEALVRTHIAYLVEHPAMVKLIARALLSGKEDPCSQTIFEGFAGIRSFAHAALIESLELAKKRGEIRPVDTIQTILNIISMDVFVFIGNPIISRVFPDIDMDALVRERADHVIDLLMNGLRQKSE
jgi:TetR/AcrR family transcriptional regulator